jgi:putative DNA primase/helicase
VNVTDAQIAELSTARVPADDLLFAAMPADLSALAERAPTMPAQMLPDSLGPWIEDVCNRMRVPLEMLAVPCIVAAAALVGRGRAIRPKARDDWTVVPNLWGCVVAPPGMLKSPAMAEALRPFQHLVAARRGAMGA